MSDIENKRQANQAFLRKNPYGTAAENTFSGALSFLRRRYSRDLKNVDIAILGVPFDMATSYRPGARFGPNAVRTESVQLAELKAFPYGFDPCDTLNIIDYGDVDFDFGHPEMIVKNTYDEVMTILKAGGKTLSLGGDHFITYPIIKAYHDYMGEAFSLLHFDAHPDTWPDDEGRLDHGSMFTRAVNEKILNADKSAQVGIRTWVGNKRGFHHLDAPFIHERGITATINAIRDVIGDNKVYLTFDIDCLDPAFAPGTGTPVAGGISSADALTILRGLKDLDFIGMDVVEVSPAYDHAGMTALAAASIAYEWLCIMASKRKV